MTNMLHPTLEKVRISSAQVYQDLVKSHLSHLLDIEMGFDYDAIEFNPSSHLPCATIFGAPLTQEGICTLNQLIGHVLLKRNIVEEGLFRRCGGVSRQRRLQERLCSGTSVDISRDYTVHDVCGIIKQFCRELPQPLLTNQLRELFRQTNDLSDDKKLDSLRLLLLLLPSPNRIFFTDLIKMFVDIVNHSEHNKMGSSNLATIFAPILFLPNDLSSEKFKSLLDSGTMSKCLQFMIDRGVAIFEPPEKLLSDCRLYLTKLATRRQATTPMNQFISSTSLIPATQYCVKPDNCMSSKDYTQQMLAELKEQANAMALSNKNKKVLKNIKRTDINTPLTKLKRDREQKALIKESLKKSGKYQSSGLKSFGSAIRKFMTPNSEKVLGKGASGNSSGRKKRSPTKRKSISGSVLLNQFEVTPNNAITTKPHFSSNEDILQNSKPKTPVNKSETTNTPLRARRRSVSMNTPRPKPPTVVRVESPIDEIKEVKVVDHNSNIKVMGMKPPLIHRLVPPPLPPKPSPATIMRNFSLQERAHRSEVKRRPTNVSTKSLPCSKTCSRVPSVRFEVKPMPSPLTELSNQRMVTTLRDKYESLTKMNSKIPRFSSSKQFNCSNYSEGYNDENYVCLSSIPKLNLAGAREKRPQTHCSQLPKPKQMSLRKRPSKSPRSIKPIPEDLLPFFDNNRYQMNRKSRISVRQPRRQPFDLNNLQPQTPL